MSGRQPSTFYKPDLNFEESDDESEEEKPRHRPTKEQQIYGDFIDVGILKS